MISEREEYTFKNGGTIILTNGEDGVTVELIGFDEPMMGTYNDMEKLAEDIGAFLKEKRPEIFKEDEIHWKKSEGVYISPVPEHEKEIYKVCVRLRRINPTYLWQTYSEWMWGEDQQIFWED